MKRKFFLGGLILLAFLAQASAAEPQVMRLATDPWPPYSYGSDDGGDLERGITLDILNALGDRMNKDVVANLYPWKRVLLYLREGDYDITLPIQYKPEREEFLAFSDVLVEDRVYIWYLKNSGEKLSKWRNIDDLNSFKLGVVDGYTQGAEFDQAIAEKRIPSEAATSSEENFKKLLAKRVDGIIEVESVAQGFFLENPEWRTQIERAPTVVNIDRYRVGISKKSPFLDLIPEMNAAIQSLHNDGTINRIMGR